MRRTWVQELGQQGHYCEFGNRKGENAGTESGHGILDDILLVLETQSIEMSTAAGCCRCTGDA